MPSPAPIRNRGGAGGSIEQNELIRAVLAGDKDAYGEIVRAHQERILRLCASLLGGALPAEDAAQDVFVKAYQALPRFQGGSSLATWLHRIAVNHCMDLLRQTARRRTESWEALVEREGEKVHSLFAWPAGDAPGLADLAGRILSRLEPDQRAVLVLREIQGLSYQEMAAVMGCSLDAVKARLRRARLALQEAARHFKTGSDV